MIDSSTPPRTTASPLSYPLGSDSFPTSSVPPVERSSSISVSITQTTINSGVASDHTGDSDVQIDSPEVSKSPPPSIDLEDDDQEVFADDGQCASGTFKKLFFLLLSYIACTDY